MNFILYRTTASISTLLEMSTESEEELGFVSDESSEDDIKDET